VVTSSTIFFLEAFAHAFDLAEPVFRHQLVQGLGQAFQGPSRVRVGARLEGVSPFQLQQGANLVQDFRDLVFVHAPI
jgi:hypothetical protein